ncbi:MFS transporter [Desulfosporosinus sp. PR]|uniref:MFS transporter n=1 Tax=Candidatus Desulfosporosinus nitrosoreducens TaxID=3401928 RepID=UPI0027FC2718|nr:MFS transporter [Desulfosporosinus sp. PR]MDQ7093873.1 MFS transporter [Desulfosporosinus sp. PR]
MKSKRNIGLMYTIALLQGMVFYGPIATLYRQAAGISIFQITIIESISLIVCLLLELPWGIIADKVGYKNTLIFCCVLYFFSKIVFWRANGFAAFLLERIMLSIVIAGMSGVDTSILYISAEAGNSQKIFGIYNNLQTAGVLFAALVYSLFVKGDYRLAGFLTVISYGIAAMVSFGLVEVKNANETHKINLKELAAMVRLIITNKRSALFLIGVALLNETHQTVTVFLNQLQYVRCGLSDAAIGYSYIGVTIVGMTGIFSGRLTGKLGVVPLASILYGMAVVACLILAIVSNAWLSVAAIVLLRVSFSLLQPLQMDVQNKRVVMQNRATELSINSLFIDCVGVGTNLVYGKLAAINLSMALFIGAALCLIGYLCIRIDNFHRQDNKEEKLIVE